MKKLASSTVILILVLLLGNSKALGQERIQPEPFEFQFENKTLRGLIEKPINKSSEAIVIIVPGYGKTDFVEGNWYASLRKKLASYGLTVVVWDKMGCGNSDGEFDINQPVENSADEAISAIQELKKSKITRDKKIGFWGISRAGWIVPLINEKFPIDFWISVSGTDDKENFGYLLRTNLILEGKDEEEADKLYQAWMLGHKIFSTKGNYEDYVSATEPLRQDSLSRKLFGYSKKIKSEEDEDKKEYYKDQKKYTSKGHLNEKSGLWTYIDNFDQTLSKINSPVLALFGANDSQVDWRKTKRLYEETIGVNQKSELTVKVFENCNHVIQKCITCAWKEDLSALKRQPCNSYYETMEKWLKKNRIIE